MEILISCAELLDKLAYNDTIAMKATSAGALDIIKEIYPRYCNNLEFLRAFTLLFGTICRS